MDDEKVDGDVLQSGFEAVLEDVPAPEIFEVTYQVKLWHLKSIVVERTDNVYFFLLFVAYYHVLDRLFVPQVLLELRTFKTKFSVFGIVELLHFPQLTKEELLHLRKAVLIDAQLLLVEQV